MIIRRWHLVSLVGGQAQLIDLLRETVWASDEICTVDYDEAVRAQDRSFLDGPVSMELAVYAVASVGLVFWRGENEVRSFSRLGGDPVPAAQILSEFGGEFAEEVLEKGSRRISPS